jgi:hypothetical protein
MDFCLYVGSPFGKLKRPLSILMEKLTFSSLPRFRTPVEQAHSPEGSLNSGAGFSHAVSKMLAKATVVYLHKIPLPWQISSLSMNLQVTFFNGFFDCFV